MAPNKNAGKAAAKAAKKAKQADKAAKKEAQAIKATTKGKGKGKDVNDDDDEDLDAILARYKAEMEAQAANTVVTLESPPPPRTGALFLASPSTLSSESNHLYLLFGEYFDGSRATFYSSTLRYDVVKDEWREYKSGIAPAPRSSAAGVAGAGLAEGGGILIFGGEYASPTQTSFHHYKDMWLFSCKTHSWDKIEFKRGPSGRSGHRMALWKQYVILFGGFIDVGVKTNYLSDLWIFDTTTYKWTQIEHIDKDRAPGPRSGFSFIPTPEGAFLYGGYRKEYVKGTRPKGMPLDDGWLLRMDEDLSKLKWERRKKAGYAPSLRSGSTMAHWASKGMGVLFGGVLDEEKDEESMESVFYNDLFAYNPAGNGRWTSLNLKKRKKMGGKRRAKKAVEVEVREDDDDMDVDGEEGEDDEGDDDVKPAEPSPSPAPVPEPDDDADDPMRTTPLTRYNAMLAIVKNTLFIYGGIYETTNPAREYTLDDFITLNLEKLDRFNHLRGTGLEELEWKGSDDEGGDSDSDDEDDEDEDDDDDDEEEIAALDDDEDDDAAKEARHAALTQAEKDELRKRAAKFMGVAKDATRTDEDVLSTPLPGENLRMFYERTKEYWAGTAYGRSGSRGKALRREGFHLSSARYEEYRPLLEEIERIQREAELDAAAVAASKRTAMGVVGEGGRNRR
ncbi:Kelch repeat-containing protein 3 [Vanrija albida]|uniref:Kelch repeat-containing protein 3 n=1 Tax=Vanrija albida TaxID=181172 RepID=A0ABR3Q798_9TREE